MKDFYGTAAVAPEGTSLDPSYIGTRARVAVYDGPAAAPRVIDVEPAPASEYIEALAGQTYDLAKSQGGTVPYTVIREVTENLIHAGFAEPVISVMDGGQTIRFADQGPGIADKKRAVLPGFTTATSGMKRHIRGVGSGLPIVNDYLSLSGGRLTIEDNLGCGSVITLSCATRVGPQPVAEPAPVGRYGAPPAEDHSQPLFAEDHFAPRPVSSARLSTRQKQVLALVLESGSAGPSLVARELNIGISTAYRDLASLEEQGLILADGGKRTLTPEGLSYLDGLAG
jgi:DNA segregation ATPase FtsK/SpoIIIE-like protein